MAGMTPSGEVVGRFGSKIALEALQIVVAGHPQSKPGRGKYRQIFLNGFESVPLSSNPET